MKFFKLMSFSLLMLFGCKDAKTTEIPMGPMGFNFHIPSEWEQNEDIFAVPLISESSLDFSFYFLTDSAKEQKKILEAKSKISSESVNTICDKAYKLFKISVYKKDDFQNDVKSGKGWSNISQAGSNQEYFIYFAQAQEVQVEAKYAEKYQQYLAQSKGVKATIKTYEPKREESASSSLPAKIIFSAPDLQGNKHDSKTIFAQNKYTMVNVWGTYCSPCVQEMPELAKMDKELKDFAVLGIVIDGENNLEIAKNILAKSGAEFLNLLPNPEIKKSVLATVSAIPTSFFVNQDGEVVSEIIVGANPKAYQKQINKLFK